MSSLERSRSRRLSLVVVIWTLLFSGGLIPSVSKVVLAQGNTLRQHDRAAPLIAQGSAALQRGDRDAAKQFFTEAAAVDPRSEEALTYLGIIADSAGDPTAAERFFANAVRVAPKSAAALNNHGASLIKIGRVDQAAVEFETSLRVDQNQRSALVNLAQILFNRGRNEDLKRAQALFQRADAQSRDLEVARALTIVALKLVDRGEATLRYREYAELLKHSTSDTLVVEATTRREMGEALLASGLTEEASAEFDAALAANPQDVNTIVLAARAAIKKGELVKAGRTLESALARGVEAGSIYFELATVYEKTAHLENAIPAMRLAIEHEPGNESYRFRYGMLLVDSKAPAAAVIRLKEALRVFPLSSRLWFALGVAEYVQSQTDTAVQHFNKAVAIDPKFAPAIAYLAITYDVSGQYDKAISLYERALAVDESQAVVHQLIANAMLKHQDADISDVQKHLVRAVELDPTFVQARLSLGKVYLRSEQFADAAKQFERAIALSPTVAEAHYQLGRAYMKLKRPREGQAELALFKQMSDAQRDQAEIDRQEIVRRLASVRF
jgi:tetratricopeptide (TPR) repeat protein